MQTKPGMVPFIPGDGFYLRALHPHDLEGNWTNWLNDAEVTYFQDKGYFPQTLEAQSAYFETLRDSCRDVVFAIVDEKKEQHIGCVGLHQINWIHRTAVLGILLGEKAFWGRGIGRAAWALITAYGFNTLNLHKITATVLEGNERSLACALNAGFVVEGKQAAQIYKHGQYYDLIYIGVNHQQWQLSQKDKQNG